MTRPCTNPCGSSPSNASVECTQSSCSEVRFKTQVGDLERQCADKHTIVSGTGMPISYTDDKRWVLSADVKCHVCTISVVVSLLVSTLGFTLIAFVVMSSYTPDKQPCDSAVTLERASPMLMRYNDIKVGDSFRVKRDQTNLNTASLNVNVDGGVPIDLIATLTGDSDYIAKNYTIQTNDRPAQGDTRQFYRTCYDRNCCGETTCCDDKCCDMVRNNNNELFCPHMSYFEYRAESNSENIFRYFRKAEWMHRPTSNYRLLDNGMLQVQSSGLYLLQADVGSAYPNLRFFQTVAVDIGRVHFYLSKGNAKAVLKWKDSNMGDQPDIAQCTVDFIPHRAQIDRSVWPCSVFHIAQLNAGDKVYLWISNDVLFSVTKQALSMTVIKLNSYSLQATALAGAGGTA